MRFKQEYENLYDKYKEGEKIASRLNSEQPSGGRNRSLSNSRKSLEVGPLSNRSNKWASRDFEKRIDNSRIKSQARLLSREEHY